MPDDHSKLVPLLPIPNRTVKRLSADDSAGSRVKVGHRQALTMRSAQLISDQLGVFSSVLFVQFADSAENRVRYLLTIDHIGQLPAIFLRTGPAWRDPSSHSGIQNQISSSHQRARGDKLIQHPVKPVGHALRIEKLGANLHQVISFCRPLQQLFNRLLLLFK
jgi:hypothetical protein